MSADTATVAAAPSFVLTIATPTKPMPSLNTLLRSHWAVRGKWRDLIAQEAMVVKGQMSPDRRARFPLQRARLEVTVYYCGVQGDATNMVGGITKLCEDALTVKTGVGILADDSPACLESVLPVLVRVAHKRERRVELKVFDLAGQREREGGQG